MRNVALLVLVISVLSFAGEEPKKVNYDYRGDGYAAYFDSLPKLDEFYSIRPSAPANDEYVRAFVKYTAKIFTAADFIATDVKMPEFEQARITKKNMTIAATLALGLKDKPQILSDKEVRETFEGYYKSRTKKDLRDVPNEDLRNTLAALLYKETRAYQNQMEKFNFWTRKKLGMLSPKEIEQDRNTPTIRAKTKYDIEPPKDAFEAKQRYHEYLRREGYSTFYLMMDGFFNPAWNGTGNITDITAMMAGFATPAPVIQTPVIPHKAVPTQTH